MKNNDKDEPGVKDKIPPMLPMENANGPRRSAQMFVKDIRDPHVIQMIMDDFKGMKRFNYVVPLTKEFIDAYLQESENAIAAKQSPQPGKDMSRLWQPTIDGKPVGDPVSATQLYVRMGGTLCNEIRLPTPKP